VESHPGDPNDHAHSKCVTAVWTGGRTGPMLHEWPTRVLRSYVVRGSGPGLEATLAPGGEPGGPLGTPTPIRDGAWRGHRVAINLTPGDRPERSQSEPTPTPTANEPLPCRSPGLVITIDTPLS
jgi:hypothetical protein